MVTFLGAIFIISFNSTTDLQKVIISLSWFSVLFLIATTIFANWQRNAAPFSALILFFWKKFGKKAKEAKQEMKEIITNACDGGATMSDGNSFKSSSTSTGGSHRKRFRGMRRQFKLRVGSVGRRSRKGRDEEKYE